MRDWLIELLENCEHISYLDSVYDLPNIYNLVADYLLANGVIVPPCKVGDKTFLLLEKTSGGYDIVESECVYIAENKYSKVYSMAFDCPEIGNTLEYHLADFGKWVFLTKEEAEQALKERENSGC